MTTSWISRLHGGGLRSALRRCSRRLRRLPLRGDDLRHITLRRWRKAGLHLRDTAGSCGTVFAGPLAGTLRHIALRCGWKAGPHVRDTAGSWGIVFILPPAWHLPGLLAWALGFTAWGAIAGDGSGAYGGDFSFAGNTGRSIGHRILGRAGLAGFFFHRAWFGLLGRSGTGLTFSGTAFALMRLKVSTKGGRWCGAGDGALIFLLQLGWARARQFIALLLAQDVGSLGIGHAVPATINLGLV